MFEREASPLNIVLCILSAFTYMSAGVTNTHTLLSVIVTLSSWRPVLSSAWSRPRSLVRTLGHYLIHYSSSAVCHPFVLVLMGNHRGKYGLVEIRWMWNIYHIQFIFFKQNLQRWTHVLFVYSSARCWTLSADDIDTFILGPSNRWRPVIIMLECIT